MAVAATEPLDDAEEGDVTTVNAKRLDHWFAQTSAVSGFNVLVDGDCLYHCMAAALNMLKFEGLSTPLKLAVGKEMIVNLISLSNACRCETIAS